MRICANCGAVEPNRLTLILRPSTMFMVRAGASSPHDFCTFDCSREYQEREAAKRGDGAA